METTLREFISAAKEALEESFRIAKECDEAETPTCATRRAQWLEDRKGIAMERVAAFEQNQCQTTYINLAHNLHDNLVTLHGTHRPGMSYMEEVNAAIGRIEYTEFHVWNKAKALVRWTVLAAKHIKPCKDLSETDNSPVISLRSRRVKRTQRPRMWLGKLVGRSYESRAAAAGDLVARIHRYTKYRCVLTTNNNDTMFVLRFREPYQFSRNVLTSERHAGLVTCATADGIRVQRRDGIFVAHVRIPGVAEQE